MRNLVARRQPAVPARRVALAGLGGAVAIGALALIADISDSGLLAAAFGASCVLVFTVPEAPLSQPVNVVGGHLVAASCGLLVASVLPVAWWSVALAVGLAIAAMAALRVTHPPAGANPIVVMTVGASWWYLLVPILAAAVIVVVVGMIFHRAAGADYPIRPLAEPTKG